MSDNASDTVYRTVDGDVLDAICHKHYGSALRYQDVLAANPGLCDLPAVLPIGVEIRLPVFESSAETEANAFVSLWE